MIRRFWFPILVILVVLCWSGVIPFAPLWRLFLIGLVVFIVLGSLILAGRKRR